MKTVERGAALLDDTFPGWADLINDDELDLSDARYCVVGQLYRRRHPRSRIARKVSPDAYFAGLNELGLTCQTDNRYGFRTWGRGRWFTLTSAWERAIAARRTA